MTTDTLNCSTCPDEVENLSLSIPDLPDAVQKDADVILAHLAGNGLTPKLTVEGHPITIAVQLAKEFKGFTPAHLAEQGNNVLGFLVQNIAQYARETHAATLAFDFQFKRGRA